MDKNLYEILITAGVPSFIILIITVFFVLLKYKKVRIWIGGIIRNIFLSKESLNNHYLFGTDKYYNNMIDAIELKTPEKCFIFRTLMRCKKNSIIRASGDWVNSNIKKINKMTKAELMFELTKLVYDIIEDYESAIVGRYVKRYGIMAGYKIFDRIYNNEDGFKAYHDNNVHSIMTFLNNLTIYENVSNKVLVYTYLGKLEASLLLAIDDLYTIFKSFNGELDKLIYEGQHHKK